MLKQLKMNIQRSLLSENLKVKVNKHWLTDGVKKTFNIGMCFDVYKLVSFKLGTMT